MEDLELTTDEQSQVEEQAKRLRDWLETSSGEQSVQAASQRSKEAATKRAEARRVAPEQLEKPVTC